MGKHTLIKSFYYAIKGVLYVFFTQRNMKIHIIAALLVCLLGFFLEISRLEWVIIIICIFLVLITEIINTAIEKTVDLVTREYHYLAKIAKNMAAAAVLLAAINAIIIAFIIFGPYILAIAHLN